MGHVLLLPSGSSRLIFTREGAHLDQSEKMSIVSSRLDVLSRWGFSGRSSSSNKEVDRVG